MGAGPDDGHAPAGEVARGPVEGGGHQGRRGPVDAGLGVGALADPKGLLEERVQNRADRSLLLAEAQRVACLAEDLCLADRHRVEAGGDPEQVRDRAVVVVDVEVRDQRLDALAGGLEQTLGDVLHAAVEAVDRGVDLEPVAGRDDRRLGDVRVRQTSSTSLAAPPGSTARRSRRAMGAEAVGDAHDQGRHAVSWVALRCSW
jgi:hypothetical protein